MKISVILLYSFMLFGNSIALLEGDEGHPYNENEDGDYSYDKQDEWSGVCVEGNRNRQSPIDINNVRCRFSLPDLQFDGWDTGYNGTFKNSGHSVEFVPDTTGLVSMRYLYWKYLFQQFHFHWGRRPNEGSEHLVKSRASEAEIHFVHTVQNREEVSRYFNAVIGVLADVDESMPITGPWAELNSLGVIGFEEFVEVPGFRLDQLLPANRDYYFYEGSLTTPPCTEGVAWFLLKE